MTTDQAPLVASPTEERNQRTMDIDTLDTAGIVELITAEDAGVARAVAAAAGQIAVLADLGVAALNAGGRIIYCGAGTSGRLAVLDAAELLPTYGVGPEQVSAHMAGGSAAASRAIEDAEDDPEGGAADIGVVRPNDVVIGLAASGRTPYVRGALQAAAAAGASTGLIACNPNAELAALVDVAVLVDTGPEVITGSTRMKAGTAQKLVLNTFSTVVMVRTGKTYSNLMIDMLPTNEKLRGRSVRMLVQATGRSTAECSDALTAANDPRIALVALLRGSRIDEARAAVAASPTDSARVGDPSGIRTAARRR